MKNKLTVIFFLVIAFVYAQENLKFTYKKLGGEELQKSSFERVRQIGSSFKELEYELILNKKLDTVVFRIVDKVFSDNFNKGAISFGGGETYFYTNSNNDYKVWFLNKISNYNSFIAKESINNVKWKITNESKKINNYTCYKATTTKITKRIKGFDEKKGEFFINEIKIDLVAWFCPEFPFSFGPDQFYGLPGIVFEGYNSNGSIKFVLDKIEYLKEKTKIIMPKYEVITEDESTKKMLEMMKNMN